MTIQTRPVVCAGLAGLGWAGVIFGDGSNQWLTLIFVLWAAAAAVILYPLMKKIKFSPTKIRARGMSVTDLKHDYFTEFWLWVERYIHQIRKFRERYAEFLRKVGSGLTYDYDLNARRAVHLSLSLAPLISVPLITGELVAIAAALAPIVILYPLIQVHGRVRQHAVQVQEEMSFFLCYLATMQGVGYTLYTALDRVRDAQDVFIAIARDAASVRKMVTLGTPHMEALRKYAINHPVQEFRDFLHGYISKHETVGPVPSYTESKAEQFFELYSQTWNNYKSTAMMMATMAVMTSVMIPIMMVMMVFISTQSSVNMILGLGPIIGPILAMLMLFMVGSAQPSTGVKMKPWLPSLGVGIAAAVIFHFAWLYAVSGEDLWDTEPGITISVGFIAAGLANYIMVRKQIGGAADVDRGLPEFLEDVTEQSMAGSSITRILRQQARGSIYTGLFGRLLRGIVSRLETGATMEVSCREARKHSRYLAFTLFIIIRLHEIGATSPTVLQQMTRFMAGIVTTKIDVIKSLRMGAMMIYISPLMMVGISSAMFAMFGADQSNTASLAAVLPEAVMSGFGPPDPDAKYEQRLGMMGALLTCPMGLVAAKITKFTSVDTMPVVIVAAVNIAALIMVPIMLEAFMM